MNLKIRLRVQDRLKLKNNEGAPNTLFKIEPELCCDVNKIC